MNFGNTYFNAKKNRALQLLNTINNKYYDVTNTSKLKSEARNYLLIDGKIIKEDKFNDSEKNARSAKNDLSNNLIPSVRNKQG